MKPNIVGSKSLYLNPSWVSVTTSDVGLIDTALAQQTVQPYAYTATVRDDYDTMNFQFADGGASLVTASRVAFGVFLSPDNDKHNLIFQVSGAVSFNTSGTANAVLGRFFFGRKATNNTVVSDKASANNDLAKYRMLESKSVLNTFASTTLANLNYSCQEEIFALELAGGYCWCFGFMLDNHSGSSVGIAGSGNISIRKYSTGISAFKPSYV